MYFHRSAATLSDDFRRNARRQNYVTPTSFLELLSQFSSSLGIKQTEVKSARQRYVVGLEKLEFATQQVRNTVSLCWGSSSTLHWQSSAHRRLVSLGVGEGSCDAFFV